MAASVAADVQYGMDMRELAEALKGDKDEGSKLFGVFGPRSLAWLSANAAVKMKVAGDLVRLQKPPTHPAQGITATVIATQLCEAYKKDADGEGIDLEAGLLGQHMSDWVRRLAGDFLRPLSAGPEPDVTYVLGFMFDKRMNRVVLIRKKKPAWQAGKLNGVGGKLEAGETIHAAMVREFREETGLETMEEQWSHFLTMTGEHPNSFRLECFASIGRIQDAQTMEEEEVVLFWPHMIHTETGSVENLSWIVGAAIDHLQDGRPAFINARYP